MQREEAIKLINQIYNECNHSLGKSVKLMPPNADGVLSKGCQVHIETNDDEYLEPCLHKIAKKHDLSVHKEGRYLILYRKIT